MTVEEIDIAKKIIGALISPTAPQAIPKNPAIMKHQRQSEPIKKRKAKTPKLPIIFE